MLMLSSDNNCWLHKSFFPIRFPQQRSKEFNCILLHYNLEERSRPILWDNDIPRTTNNSLLEAPQVQTRRQRSIQDCPIRLEPAWTTWLPRRQGEIVTITLWINTRTVLFHRRVTQWKTVNNIKIYQQVASMEDLNYLLIKFSNSSQFYNKMTQKGRKAGAGRGVVINLTLYCPQTKTCKTAMLVPVLQNTVLNQ